MKQNIVLAFNEPLEPRQVLRVGRRRYEIVKPLTRDEYQIERRLNARFRAATGRRFEDHVLLGSGADPMNINLDVTLTTPPEPPEECGYFYKVREI